MKKQQAALLSIISNSILIIFKLFTGICINSVSVISDGVHSSIDLVASVISFFSIKRSNEKEDDEHPFGHGKYENVSSFFEAILILVTGVIIIYEAFCNLILKHNIKYLYPGMIVMALSCFINLIVSVNILHISKNTKSISLKADGLHLLTDSVTSFGVLVGLVLVKLTGLSFFDSLSSIFVAVIIIKTSATLIENSVKDLVDSSLSRMDLEKIIAILKSHPEIRSFHKLRTRKSGETREINMHLLFDSNKSIVQVHDVCTCVECEINKLFNSSNTLIHAEPYLKSSSKKLK